MRRIEGSGEKEFKGATDVICLRISSKAAGWKTCRSWRSVIRRVLEGGVGWESGGRLAISRDSDGRAERNGMLTVGEDPKEDGGEAEVAILCVGCMFGRSGGRWIREDKESCHQI